MSHAVIYFGEKRGPCYTNMEKLTESQMEAFQQFKKNISDVLAPHDTDAILFKWLAARNYNPRKAEVYYREMQAFYQTYELDKILLNYENPEVAEKYQYTAFMGFAKDGSIVRYTHFGTGDHLGFISCLSAYELGRFCMNLMAKDIALQRREYKRTGREINENTYILDLEGFSIHNVLHKSIIESGLDLTVLLQDYYPDIWGNIFCINVPGYFDIVFNIFKPILKLSVFQKIQVSTKESTAQLLLKYIDADVLPAFLGGTRVDTTGNPRCTEFLKFGGKIPLEYYPLRRGPLLMPEEPGVGELWVGARGVFNYSMVASKPGGTIRIEFRTEKGSIHLRLLYRALKPDSETQDVPGKDEYLDERDEKTNVRLVSPGFRIQSHVAPVNDFCKAPWPGIYIFRFSNSSSLFGSRRLIYRIKLIESVS